ncbi:MAG: bifunctional riboflavin kinase/FAD synthetase [Azospirillaceae bacterium]|nr:bifunctional riboflavin kinase/FAD synthetase [Azospirillaceae bacterium]
MRLFRHYSDLADEARGAVVALGNFDGVHRGHAALIEAAQQRARDSGRKLAVVTFEPHPRSLFQPDAPPFRLTPFRVKTRELAALGVELCFTLHFDAAFALIPAEDFVKTVLVDGLAACHVVCGYDFVFGHGRVGDGALLRRLAVQHGFAATVIAPICDPAGEPYSSTRIRRLLQDGAVREAAAVLGRPWTVDGRVEHGDQRGRTIGFPTANLDLADYVRPAYGVYAVRALPENGVWHHGVANLGRRPTVDGFREWFEVHLFDVSPDLYGRHLRVELVEFLRPEQRFASLAALKEQIAADVVRARQVLAAP